MSKSSSPASQRAYRRSLLSVVALAAALVVAVAGCATLAPDPAAIKALAPTGKLRVGLYPGTPTSILGDPAAANAKGVGFDLGRELAKRAGVPFDPVVFPNNAAVFAAAKSGSVDMVFTNATPARMQDLDFSPAVLQVEQGYLVALRSAIRAIDDVDRAGMRIGVSQGSTSEATLSRELHNATIVHTPTLKAAADMLAAGKLDAFATNKAILFEMSDEVPGSRLLDGRFGMEALAVGIPKGRTAAMPLVNRFVADAKADGTVARAVERAGLRGAVPAR